MKGFSFGILLVVLLAALSAAPGCAPRKTYAPTPEGEFEAAYDKYQKGNYSTAIDDLKQLIYKYPGSDLIEQARYYLADAYFQRQEYLLAASEFERLNREFPQGQYADESIYKAGLSYAELSRRPERDQNETQRALDLFETLLAKYPSTEFADEARAEIAKLQDKLSVKQLMTAKYYFKRQAYDAAIIYLKDLLAANPESSIAPEALYHLYLASNKMGYPDDARDARAWLCRSFPQSEYAAGLCEAGADTSATVADSSVTSQDGSGR